MQLFKRQAADDSPNEDKLDKMVLSLQEKGGSPPGTNSPMNPVKPK